MAAPSEVAICNSALLALREDTITSLTDESKRAILCNHFYEETRDAMLRAYPWNFALERKELAQISTAPAFEYTYAYQLPADPDHCLRVLRMEHRDTEYIIRGRTLETDESSVKILYVKRVTDPAQFDASFYETLAARMAMKLALAITGKRSWFQDMTRLYEFWMEEAAAADAFESPIHSASEMTETEGLLDVRV